ncbi:MAG TPA: hypothetical protein PLP01_10015 [Phycisphaerae bacterium]|nr:hypothetical protein [Phycisphaerae bacterium]HOI55572.1 hypothetical protein [Phycisphaerae bacterium]
MGLGAQEMPFALAEYKAVRDEIVHLKNCQVRLVEIGLVIIGAVGTVLGFHTLSAETSAEGGTPECATTFWIVLVIPAVFPVLGWLIVHKCRSAFRAIAWCRVIEEFVNDAPAVKGMTYRGYESCYAQLRNCSWLVERETKSPGWIRILKEWILPSKGKVQVSTTLAMSPDAATRVEQPGYIGTYYSVILSILMVFALLGWVAFVALMFITGCVPPSVGLGWVASVVAVTMGIYFSLSFRYLMHHCVRELGGQPFSIQAHYEMFKQVLSQKTPPSSVQGGSRPAAEAV